MTQSKRSKSPARVPVRASLVPTMTLWHREENDAVENCPATSGSNHVAQKSGTKDVSTDSGDDLPKVLPETNFSSENIDDDVTPSVSCGIAPAARLQACWTCGGTKFWRFGKNLHCGMCHPPATPAHAAEWIEVTASTKT